MSRQSMFAAVPYALGVLVACIPLTACGQIGDVSYVHDPCIIKEKDTYYLFSTGMAHVPSVGPGIQVRRSKDLIHWERCGQVFRELPAWIAEEVTGVKDLWAPDVLFIGGQYRLYYSASVFGSAHACIGLATNETLDPDSENYEWVDRGMVIKSKPNKHGWRAIDSNAVTDQTNDVWMAFGSFGAGIKLCKLDPGTGKPSTTSPTGRPRMRTIAARPQPPGAIEAAFVFRRGAYYYLFVSFDYCCKGAASDYKIMVGRSRRIAGPHVDRAGKSLRTGGGTLVLAGHNRCRGPGHCAVLAAEGKDWLVHHYYDAGDHGIPKLHIRPLVWDDGGWPLAGEPIEARQSTRVSLTACLTRGEWLHSVDFSAEVPIKFLPNGRLNKPGDSATWSLDGSRLELRWPHEDTPGGYWLDKCTVSPYGTWYVGRNQAGAIVRGRKKPSK